MVVPHAPIPSDQAAKRAWVAEQLAGLTPEERARVEGDAFFRSFVLTALEREWQSPRAEEEERAVRAAYGDDHERELADLEAGRHPLQIAR
jgi:hypothetical protein